MPKESGNGIPSCGAAMRIVCGRKKCAVCDGELLCVRLVALTQAARLHQAVYEGAGLDQTSRDFAGLRFRYEQRLIVADTFATPGHPKQCLVCQPIVHSLNQLL